MTCTECGASNDKDRLPKGWKRVSDDHIYCKACKDKAYVLRAITLPVAQVDDWPAFREDLRNCWRLTTTASNWMMTELYARDVRRNGEDKIPPMPKVYLYPETSARFPGLPSQSRAALEQSVQKKYRAKRYEIIWTCASSLPTFRYPTPYPVPNNSWRCWSENSRPHVSLKLEKRWTLRLRDGHKFRRQLAGFADLESGAAIKGQIDLYPQDKDIMCKIVGWFPRKAWQANYGTLYVRTMADSLLCALNEKDETLWQYNGDHIARWSAQHSRQLQRWAEDSKFEQRPIPSFADRRSLAAQKYHDRTDSAVKEIAAQLVGYAKRRKFAELRYTDSDTSFCQKFKWFALRQRIKVLCDEAGIKFEHASGPVEQESPEALAIGEV